MPFLAEYVCEAGHRSEHLHMESRETAPATIPCAEPACSLTAERAIGCWARKPGKIDLSQYALKGQEPWKKPRPSVTDGRGREWDGQLAHHWR